MSTSITVPYNGSTLTITKDAGVSLSFPDAGTTRTYSDTLANAHYILSGANHGIPLCTLVPDASARARGGIGEVALTDSIWVPYSHAPNGELHVSDTGSAIAFLYPGRGNVTITNSLANLVTLFAACRDSVPFTNVSFSGLADA